MSTGPLGNSPQHQAARIRRTCRGTLWAAVWVVGVCRWPLSKRFPIRHNKQRSGRPELASALDAGRSLDSVGIFGFDRGHTNNMFEQLAEAPADPILGLTQLFRKDPSPHKVNLSIGVYQDEHGQTPSLACISEAEQRLGEVASGRRYFPIDGLPEYNHHVQQLVLGESHPAITEQRCQTVQCLGGTGALRVAAETLRATRGPSTIWFTDPTWANHHQVFQLAGHTIRTFPWLNTARDGLDFAGLMEALGQVPAGDVVVLHGCCHNPSGVDPDVDQWGQIRQLLMRNRPLVIFDIAYQGFATGIQEDAHAIREFAAEPMDVWICNSFSKNFSLYNERVGGLTLCAVDANQSQALLSHVKRCVRGNYSNPPAHGARLVAEVLGEPSLVGAWLQELGMMRDRIRDMRQQFTALLAELLPEQDFSAMARQSGMFSFTGLDADQVARLRQNHAVYLVGSGRINLAGLSQSNLERVCQAIAETVKLQPSAS